MIEQRELTTDKHGFKGLIRIKSENIRSHPYLSVVKMMLLLLLLCVITVRAQDSGKPLPQVQDEKYKAAAAAFDEGSKLHLQGTAESLLAAIAKYKTARELFRQVDDKRLEGLSIVQLAIIKSSLDEVQEGLLYADQALKIGEAIKDYDLVIRSLNQLGNTYQKIGEYGKAMQSLKRAYGLSQVAQYKSLENNVLFDMATVYNDLGEMQESINLYERILKFYRAEDDRISVARASNNMGFAYYRLNNFQKAFELYTQSYQASVESKDESGQAATLVGIGDSLLKLNKPQEALDHYNRGMTLSIKVGNQYFISYTLYSIGTVHHFLKDYEQALDFYYRALLIQQSIQNREDESKTLNALMQLAMDSGKPQLAILYGKQAVNVNQQIRGNIKSLAKNIQQSYIKFKESTYRQLADILIAEGRLPEAQNVLDLLKEEEFKSVVRSSETTDTIPYSKAETDAVGKVENIAALERERAELLRLKAQNTLPADKQARLDQIPAEIEAANRAFRLALDALGKTEATTTIRVEEIKGEKSLQRTLGQLEKENGAGVVALYTVLGTEINKDAADKTAQPKTKVGWVIMVTPNSRKAYPIDVKDFNQTIAAFREALKSDKYDPQPLAQKLYNAIFRQTSDKQKTTLEADLETLLGGYKDKTLMWSLDGILRYVPMAALHDGKNYLVEKYRNETFTKGSLLTLTEKDSMKWQALGLGVSTAQTVDLPDGKKMDFSPLKGTETELRDIVRDSKAGTGILDGMVKLNQDFTKDTALRLWREGAYPVIHIASHYSYNSATPDDSFLLLGDGKLTFAELQDKDNLFGTVDLLTLSACDTAMGGSNGKESESFAYLAQSLGAKSVLASLWKVSDEGTPELMIRFYRLRAENPGMPKGEAFRLAQLSLLKAETKAPQKINSKGARSDLAGAIQQNAELSLFQKDPQKPLAHPYYWASFVLIGNSR